MKRKKEKFDPNAKYYPYGNRQPRFNNERRARIIVCGSRDFKDKKLAFKKLDRLTKKFRDPIIIHGAARGADRLADIWAWRRGLNCMRFKPDWYAEPKAGGIIRNRDMCKYAKEYKKNLCIAFWNGRSKGTKHTIDTARKFGIRVKIVRVDE